MGRHREGYYSEYLKRNRTRLLDGHNKRKAVRLTEGNCKHCASKRMPNSNLYCEKHWFCSIAHSRLGLGSVSAGLSLQEKLTAQNNKCPYTGERLVPGKNCWLDHIFPTSRFPKKRTRIDNVEWVSSTINKAKHNLTKDEFLLLCSAVVAFTGNSRLRRERAVSGLDEAGTIPSADSHSHTK